MEAKAVLAYFLSLSSSNQEVLLTDLNKVQVEADYDVFLKFRGDDLDNKRAGCPYCNSFNFTKNGKERGSRKYKCKDCKRGFTEHTGTWISGLHKKHLIPLFMKTLEENLSLIKSSKEVGLSELTVFNWRHRLLSCQKPVAAQEKPLKE